MNTPSSKPVILVERGTIGEKAIHDLRESGYTVVQAKDTSAVKQFYPESFNAVSRDAKVAAFEYALTQEDCYLSRANLRMWYINQLKTKGAF